MANPAVMPSAPTKQRARSAPPRRAIDGMRGYLPRLFLDTEEANRKSILHALEARRGGSLLDIGAHGGEFTARLVERIVPVRTAAIELVDGYAETCRARGIDVIVGDVDGGLPFRDRSFDVVVANQVIEHVRRTDLLLSEIRRVLARGGVACVSTNNLSSWHNVASLVLGYQPMPMHVSDEVILGNPLTPDDGEAHLDGAQAHLRVFTSRALTELALRQGLRPTKVWGVGYYPFRPRLAALAARVDRKHAVYTCALLERAARGLR